MVIYTAASTHSCTCRPTDRVESPSQNNMQDCKQLSRFPASLFAISTISFPRQIFSPDILIGWLGRKDQSKWTSAFNLVSYRICFWSLYTRVSFSVSTLKGRRRRHFNLCLFVFCFWLSLARSKLSKSLSAVALFNIPGRILWRLHNHSGTRWLCGLACWGIA